MITRLHVQGYKSLKDLDLELRPLNVMIGPNGGGKSNTIDVFSLLRCGARGELEDALLERGLSRLVWATDDTSRFEMALTAEFVDSDDDPFAAEGTAFYRADIQCFVDRAYVRREYLVEALGPQGSQEREIFRRELGSFRAGEDTEAQVTTSRAELALAQYPQHHVGPVTGLRYGLRQCRLYSQLASDRNAEVRRPQPTRAETAVSQNGDNLVSLLHGFANGEHRETHFVPILQALSAGFDGFVDLRFPPEGEGYIGLRWHQRGFERGFTPAQLSDGQLRFLWLMTILHQPPTGGLIMIEEPEIGLHPDLIHILADSLKSVASDEKQFLIATHSPELVSWLDPEDVLVVDKDEEGATQAKRLDAEQLGEWLKDYTLGELWRMGEVGGRPW